MISTKYNGSVGRHGFWDRVEIAKFFYERYKNKIFLIVGGFWLAGFLETVGIVSILPLLESLIQQDSRSPINLAFNYGFAAAGVEPTRNAILFLLVIAFVLKTIVLIVLMRYISLATTKLSRDQLNEFLGLILSARWQFYTNRSLGHFVNAAIYESPKASACFAALCQLCEAFLRTVLLMLGAAIVSWQLFLAALVIGSAMSHALLPIIRLSERTGLASANANKELSKLLSDALHNIKPLKAMGLQDWIAESIKTQSHLLFISYSRQLFAKYALPILREPIVVVVILSSFVLLDQFGYQFSELVILAALFYRAINSWGVLQQNLQTLSINESYFWSFHEILHDASTQQEPHHSQRLPTFNNKIEFINVAFGFDEKPILKDVSLVLHNTGLTAVVGASGVGKTTIVDILCGLYQVKNGKVTLDNVDFLELSISDWRKSIGYVAQEFFVFNDTLRSNIVLNNPAVGDEEIWTVLYEVGASEFVEKLPHGLDTVLGERGLRLSGGQRQRISLARALMRRPKLLILDEITASLDPDTENKVCETLVSISKSMAILAISHQKAIVDVADYVYEVIGVDKCSAEGNVRLMRSSRQS